MEQFKEKIIMGISVGHREKEALEVQKLLTEYGCYVKTRLGLHEASNNACNSKGLIILEFIPNSDDKVQELEDKLAAIPDVKTGIMEF